MKIAVVADLLRPNGAGLMALAQARLLAVDNDVALLSGSSTAELAGQGYLHRTFTGSEAILDRPLNSAEALRHRRDFRAWMLAELADFGADLVLTHNVGRVLDQVQIAELSRTIPVGATLHDQWFTRDAHYSFEFQGSVRHEFEPGRARGAAHGYGHLTRVANCAGRLVGIAPSKWLRAEWEQAFPTLPCVHLHNPLDVEAFPLISRSEARARLGIDLDAKIIGFVGGPSHARKGFKRLNSAVRQLLQVRGDVTLLAVGGSASSVGALARRTLHNDSPVGVGQGCPPAPGVASSIAANTIVVGGVSRSLMPDLYAAMDVVVHPSAIDNLPTVPIEAGLVGTRCLATGVGGTAEAIASLDDLLDPKIGPLALSAAISAALDQAAVERIDARERRRAALVARFGYDAHVPQLNATIRWISGRSK